KAHVRPVLRWPSATRTADTDFPSARDYLSSSGMPKDQRITAPSVLAVLRVNLESLPACSEFRCIRSAEPLKFMVYPWDRVAVGLFPIRSSQLSMLPMRAGG